MKVSRTLIILLAVYLVTLGGLYSYWKSSNTSKNPSGGNQQSVSPTPGSNWTPNQPKQRLLLTLDSKELEETGVDCSKCEHSKIPPSDPQFYINISVAIGIFSGLSVGILGIDSFELKRLETLGSAEDKENVKKILRVKSDHHLLITTLLLGNAMCFETLPIFMDSLMPSWLAILLSTTVILIFGEVLPQALCTGPYQIKIAVALSPVVLGFMFLFYPVGYPIARALDYFLGHAHGIEYNKDYLKTTLSIVANQPAGRNEFSYPDKPHAHEGHAVELQNMDDGFTKEEINLFNSTLELRDIKVEEILIEWNKLFKLKFDQVINEELIKKVTDRSFSIIPVYRGEGSDVLGIIKAKNLVDYKRFMSRTIGDSYKLTQPTFIAKDNTLLELLKIFQTSKSTVVFVTSDEIRPTEKFDGSTRRSFQAKSLNFGESASKKVLGMVTLKDLFARLCQLELKDEDEHIYSITAPGRRKSMNVGSVLQSKKLSETDNYLAPPSKQRREEELPGGDVKAITRPLLKP